VDARGVVLSDGVVGPGRAMFEEVVRQRDEGVMTKHLVYTTGHLEINSGALFAKGWHAAGRYGLDQLAAGKSRSANYHSVQRNVCSPSTDGKCENGAARQY
jgi:hypothetical protein